MKILLPTRPQPDTIVAIFLLKTLGTDKFPGIENAQISVEPSPALLDFDSSVAKGVLPIDVGGGPLDHHGKGVCTSELVAQMFGVQNDPSLGKLLAYARRDDEFGKGTVSKDPLDRAFGLSGLIASLNKQYTGDPQKVVDVVLPLLDAHYQSAREHHIELPKAVAEKKQTGDYTESFVQQGSAKLRIAFVVSDKPSMPTYLRSAQGPRADVVVQKSEGGNKIAIVTRQSIKVNLAGVAALIRAREAELRGVTLPENSGYWAQEGRIPELPMWYADPATNSLLNVGTEKVDESLIPWEELRRLVTKGLELAK